MGAALTTCVPVRSVELFQAARRGDLQTLNALIQLCPELLRYQNVINRNTVWHVVASAGSVEALSTMLAAVQGRLGAGELRRALGARNDRGQTPLMLAAIQGHVEAVRWFLSQGADPWVTETNCHRTALHYAALRGHVGCVEALLERLSTAELCRYMDVRTCSGMTALHYACVGNQAAAAAQLLRRGADLLATTTLGDAYDLVALPCGSTPLHVAATTNATTAALELLRHYHAQLASPFYPDPRRRLDSGSKMPHQVAAVRRYTVLAEALHPASDLSAMFDGGDAAAAAAAGGAAEGGDGGGERVRRLADLAAATVRQQLLADIEHAEKVVLAFRNRDPARFAPAAMAATQTPFYRRSELDSAAAAVNDNDNDNGNDNDNDGNPPCGATPAPGAAADAADADAAVSGFPACCALRYDPAAAARLLTAAAAGGGSGGAAVSPFARRSTGSVADSAFARAPWLPVAQCAVCLEDEYCLLLEACHHRLCAACARDVVGRSAAMPLPCPVCRGVVLQLTSPVC